MPLYGFEDTNTNEQFEKLMSYSSKLEYLKDNPHIKSILTSAPQIVGSTDKIRRPSSEFRDRISEMKKTYKINSIPDY